MKKIFVLSLLFVILFAMPIFAEAEGEYDNEIAMNRNITLLVEEKNPSTAYSLALVPIFGPSMSAHYVSETPLDWQADEELERKARNQALFNLAPIGAGMFLDIANEGDTGLFFTSMGYLLATAHNHFFGNDMAQTAVNYNEDLHNEFDWSYPQIRFDF